MGAEKGATPMQQPLAGELHRLSVRLFVSLAAILVLVPSVWTQTGNASLEGIVEDVTGARIAHALVTVLNPDNGYHNDVSTDNEGRFQFAMLAPGSYTITVSAPDMAEAVQSGVELH